MEEQAYAKERSIFSKIFISSNEPRLRAGWRLLTQTILFLLLTVIIGFPVGIIVYILRGDTSGTVFFAVNEFIELIAVTASVYIARRFLDRCSFVSLGLKLDIKILYDVLTGIGITFLMMGSIFAAMSALGWIKLNGFAWQFDSIPTALFQSLLFLIAFVVVGWNEELLSRGYHLQTLASGINLFWGVIISSAIFGALHLGNPNATWVGAAGIFFAGLFLAYGYVRTKQLWLSIGLHIGWNFFEGVVFGFPVSGLSIYPLTRITVSGPEIWTGGAFGPEAGLIVLPAIVLGAVLIYLYTRSRVVS